MVFPPQFWGTMWEHMGLKSHCKPQMIHQPRPPSTPTAVLICLTEDPRGPARGQLAGCQLLRLARHQTNLSRFQNAFVGYWVCGDDKLSLVVIQYAVHSLPSWGIGDIGISHFESGDDDVSLILKHGPLVLQAGQRSRVT